MEHWQDKNEVEELKVNEQGQGQVQMLLHMKDQYHRHQLNNHMQIQICQFHRCLTTHRDLGQQDVKDIDHQINMKDKHLSLHQVKENNQLILILIQMTS